MAEAVVGADNADRPEGRLRILVADPEEDGALGERAAQHREDVGAALERWRGEQEAAHPGARSSVANDLAEMVTDPAQLSALRKRFESYIGEVKNKGGIR